MCDKCEWVEAAENADNLINDDDHRFSWAFDTLSGIKDTIASTKHVTEGQLRAINNIERAGKRR